MMKRIRELALAVLIGLIVGSWGPREDLRILREKTQEERSTKKTSVTSGFDAFAKLASIPDVAKKTVKKPSSGQKTEDKRQRSDQTSQTPQTFQTPQTSLDLRARIEQAAELWRTRVDLATKQWKEKLGVKDDDAASASFDETVASMNDELRETMQALADEIEQAGRMTPELSLRMMGDASRVLSETYDSLRTVLPPEQTETVSEVPVFEFIDPSVAEPLIGVQDKLGRWKVGGVDAK